MSWHFGSLNGDAVRVCGDPVAGDSRYCTMHEDEMLLAEADLTAASCGA